MFSISSSPFVAAGTRRLLCTASCKTRHRGATATLALQWYRWDPVDAGALVCRTIFVDDTDGICGRLGEYVCVENVGLLQRREGR